VSGAALHVAVGVISNEESQVLIARRAVHLHQGGRWEFPGGKVDAGEDVYAALCRELHEELDIRVISAEPLMCVDYDYPDRRVQLDVWWVRRHGGTAHGREGQALRWAPIGELAPAEFPAANAAIIARLQSAGLPG
jgi:8-oxo-dGTP diphosphatase